MVRMGGRETDVTGMTKKVISADRNPVTREIEDATENHWVWKLPIFSFVISLHGWMFRFSLFYEYSYKDFYLTNAIQHDNNSL